MKKGGVKKERKKPVNKKEQQNIFHEIKVVKIKGEWRFLFFVSSKEGKLV
jgi:hypothetical protein